MKKVIINENWEEVLVEDDSYFYAIVYNHNADKAKYIKSYDTNYEIVYPEFKTFVSQLSDSADKRCIVYLIKLPKTEQTEKLLEKAIYKGEDKDPAIIEAVDQLLSRSDVEILETWIARNELTEARKKKRKQHRKVLGGYLVWTTGCPAYDMAQFNNHMDTNFTPSKEEKDAEKAAEQAAEATNDAIDTSTTTADAGAISDAGTSEASGDIGGGEGGSEGASMGESLKLQEAKRYVKRYYVRPQNIFCSNKEEILKALVQVGDQNCSVYSLKSLADHDDVHLLKPSDIIYYYDDGILYDKNHVKVLDYDLFVKHEENRTKINPKTASDQTFRKVYSDRLTTTTQLEEDAVDNCIDQQFIVYIHTNNINGKKYVGITSQCEKNRWRLGAGYKNQPVFYKAIIKYGWENFSHEIVANNLTIKEAKELEKTLIAKYHTYVNDPLGGGYNASIGGEANLKYATAEEKHQAQLISNTKNYQKHKNTRLAKAKQSYWDNYEFYKQKNHDQYIKHRDNRLLNDKKYQAELKKELDIIRDLNELFPNKLTEEDISTISNFRNCRNKDYLDSLLAKFTADEISYVTNTHEELEESISYDTLKKELWTGESIYLGNNKAYADAIHNFSDGGVYAETSYYATYFDEEGIYEVTAWNMSDDGEEVEGNTEEFDNFEDFKKYVKALKLEDRQVEEMLKEDTIYVGKLGGELQLPPQIHLLPQQTVEEFVEVVDPEEEFTVGYVNPIYLYKEIWEIMPIYKCTEMEGYTGVDFAQSKDDVWNDKEERISNAKDQIDLAKKTGVQVPAGSDVIYSSQNKLVSRAGVGVRNTILFYPTNILNVHYFVKLPGSTEFIKINADQLEQFIYDNLDKIQRKFDLEKAKHKIHTTLFGQSDIDIDRETRVGSSLAPKIIYKYNRAKLQVRALYTSQIYYLDAEGMTRGSKITEALKKKDLAEEAFNQNFKSVNALGEEFDDVFTCCICGEESTGYGNNPEPVRHEGRCCDSCNRKFVIPARIAQLRAAEDIEDGGEA